MSTVLPFSANAESEPEIPLDDPEIPLEPDPDEVPLEPEMLVSPDSEAPAPVPAIDAGAAAALAPIPLVEVLPADFPLPVLVKFIPNPQLRIAADQAGTYALGLKVDGAEGLQSADVALQAVRTSLKAITDTFEEPVSIAYALHKRLTAMRGEWCERGEQAVKLVGQRIYAETKRLEAIAAEERRKVQAEADRLAREEARRQAEAAEQAAAPAAVVETLKQQAKTATAPPVGRTFLAPPPLKGSATVAKWKARFIGTSGDTEPNPDVTALSESQRGQLFILLRAILDGKAPLAAIAVNWSFCNKRAGSDKSTFAIPGLEAFDEGGTRAKSTRRR